MENSYIIIVLLVIIIAMLAVLIMKKPDNSRAEQVLWNMQKALILWKALER